ncbi:hypothetical protein Rs2_45159 [Raphanus sativus]|nr:hypothetical protein Rs2_45159 [Raphanus sativus]
MLGAIHFGVLAACFVLFVPMAMAGWHLSRHKLSSSAALSSSPSPSASTSPLTSLPSPTSSPPYPPSSSTTTRLQQRLELELGLGLGEIEKVLSCEFQKLDKFDVSELLNGSWVVVAGDSQARFVALSLLNLVLGSGSEAMGSVREELFKRHSDYSVVVKEIGMNLDFVWAPYEKDLDDLVVSYKKRSKFPDVVIMEAGCGICSTSTTLLISVPVTTKGGSVSGRSMHMFWIGMPVLINGMLNSEEKKEKMSDTVWHEYDRTLGESKILRQMGGPLILLDVQSFTWNCGPQCTLDGMHYDSAVYDAAVHVMLNALLIESHQTL